MSAAIPSGQSALDPAAWELYAGATPGCVLLKTELADRENRKSYLFHGALEILCARQPQEIPAVFERVERALHAGCYVSGFLSYEAGYQFEPAALRPHGTWPALNWPLVWFGVYRDPLILDAGAMPSQEIAPKPEANPEGVELAMDISRAEYRAAIQRIRRYIEAGDLYQANFTAKLRGRWNADAGSLFRRVMANQPVSYGALIHTGETVLISASPELFFRKEGSRILVRPMKGTAARGRDLEEDAERAAWLASDEKNRAENVMIVDLLRNDLGRICTMGSVRVADLFSVERHPDLLQMTSTVCGELRPEITSYDIFRSLFPCGSITGAPRIRTMQVIRELEGEPRGIGCGAIGFFSPEGEGVFSVAIRTLALRRGEVEMRVGSGITYDSDPDAEYEECLLKSRFLRRLPDDFQLIETILWHHDFFLLDLHMQRLAASARYFDFRFDRAGAEAELRRLAAAFSADSRQRVRLLLSRSGAISIASEPISLNSAAASIRISAERTDSSDRFLRHKTTRRAMYDRAAAAARARGFDDALFLNERGEVTECAIHNIMIEKSGRFLTPEVACGLLPGVYRRHLLDTHPEICEGILTLDDLLAADKVFIFNSVRGLRPAAKVQLESA